MEILSEKKLFKGRGWWKVEALDAGENRAILRITYATTAAGAVVEKLSEVKGKNIGRSNETTPAAQAVLEAAARWRKQLDKGYVETEEAAAAPATNTLGKKMPMLALPMEKVKMETVDWSTAYIQPKLDGNRCLRDGAIYSRQGKAFGGIVKHVDPAIEGTPLAALHLDGELYTHGVVLQKITGFCKKYQEGTEGLEYWLYDTVSDEPFHYRYKALTVAFLLCNNLDPRIKLTPTFQVSSLDEAMAKHREFVAMGYEGSILRWGDEGYQDDTRSKFLIKVKDFTDTEYEVTGYKLGTSNRSPEGDELLVAVFQYRIPGVDGADDQFAYVTGPGDMYEKDADARIAEQRIGQTMTIEHFGFTPKGIPNIATAKCWYEPL